MIRRIATAATNRRYRTGRTLAFALMLVAGIVGARTGITQDAGEAPAGVAVVLDLKGAIGPATASYVRRGLEKATERDAAIVILRMNTPGGLDTSMREIIEDILNAPMPVVSYVAPRGARAASAGTYISYASHVAAMAPGTNLGAATPVQVGGGDPFSRPDRPQNGDEDTKKDDADTDAPSRAHPTMSDKAVSDAVAYLRSLAQLRGRNVEWAEKAVREAASLSAGDALELNVIDLVAADLDHLLAALDGRQVEIGEEERTLATARLRPVLIEPDWRTELLAVLTNPNIAYILMIVGIYGLIFEFYSPGMILPGVVGAISLLLAAYAFNMLPVDYAGLALSILGIALLVAETLVPSFGVLGFGGIVAFIIGSVMLFDTDVPGFGVSWLLIGSMAAVSGGLLLLVMTMLLRSRRHAVVSGPEEMVGSIGHVVDWTGQEGLVQTHGELWRARGSASLEPGQAVRIAAVDSLTLEIVPANQDKGENQ